MGRPPAGVRPGLPAQGLPRHSRQAAMVRGSPKRQGSRPQASPCGWRGSCSLPVLEALPPQALDRPPRGHGPQGQDSCALTPYVL